MKLELRIKHLEQKLETLYQRTYANTLRRDRLAGRQSIVEKAQRWAKTLEKNYAAAQRVGRLLSAMSGPKNKQVVFLEAREAAQLRLILRRKINRKENACI